jgi:hypothetical protein
MNVAFVPNGIWRIQLSPVSPAIILVRSAAIHRQMNGRRKHSLEYAEIDKVEVSSPNRDLIAATNRDQVIDSNSI